MDCRIRYYMPLPSLIAKKEASRKSLMQVKMTRAILFHRFDD